MTFDYTITFSTTSVQLSAAIPAYYRKAYNNASARWVSLQCDPANTHVVYVGGNNHGIDVSSSSYGIILPLPPSNVPAAPLIINFSPAQSLDLSQFWVNGTNGEKLHVFVVL